MTQTMLVFQATYQVCLRSPTNIAGPRDSYRRPLDEALVVAEGPQQLAAVIASNVELKPGEIVELLQYKQLGRGIHDVFVAVPFKQLESKGNQDE